MEQFFELFSQINSFDLINIVFWGIAGAVSFYFSLGNARVWTSISIGFFLIFINQAYAINPWVHYYKLSAFHNIVGTVAIVAITHGLMEYHIFCRTFEMSLNKIPVYLGALLVLVGGGIFLYVNPTPSPNTIRNFKIVENSIWVFLSIINLELVRKIYLVIKDSPISKGFIALGTVFILIFLWRGSELYLQIYQWDKDWQDIIAMMADESTDIDQYIDRVQLSTIVNRYAGFLSSISVGGTFMYIFRLLR